MNSTVNEIVSDAQESCVTERVAVSAAQLSACRSLTDAYRLCYGVSGRGMKQVAMECGWTNESALSRVLGSGGDDDRRWMPHDKMLPFMVACGNSIPLQWLGLQWRALNAKAGSAGVAQVLGLTDRLDEIEAQIQLVLSEMRKLQQDRYRSEPGLPMWLLLRLVDLDTMLCGGGA